MKKTLLLLTILGLSLTLSAQVTNTSLNFESGSTANAAALWSSGSVDVISNPYKTGINTSDQCLHVLNNNYCPVFFSISLPPGAKTKYQYLSVKYKLCYVGPNGGTDLNYPNTDFYSIPSLTTSQATADASMKFGNAVGWSGVCWGSATVGTWIQFSYTFSIASLANIPQGYLVIKIAKPKLEYLIDDVELVPSPLYSPNVITLEDFEAKNVNYTLATTGSGATASVKANPTNAAQNSGLVVPKSYGNYLRLNVTLPTGRQLSDYDRLYYDRYIVASSTAYKQFSIKANNTTIYTDGSGYPSLGTNNVWQNIDVSLAALNLSAVGNSFNLDLGINSDGTGPTLTYYLDNIKLHLKDAIAYAAVTGLDRTSIPNFIYYFNNTIRISQIANQVDVFDLGGRLLITQKDVTEVNVDHLNKGIYIVKASVAGQTQVLKIVK